MADATARMKPWIAQMLTQLPLLKPKDPTRGAQRKGGAAAKETNTATEQALGP